MNKKQLKKLKHQNKLHHQAIAQKSAPYIQQLKDYAKLFDDFGEIKFLINNVIESDRLIQNGLLPQPLPKLLLPDNIQDTIFQAVNAKYPQGDLQGDALWNRYTVALPKLDKLLRNYRDYLEETYGMWSYPNAMFVNALSDYLDGAPVLEIMAGNGYLSKGLRQHNPAEAIYTTDSTEWKAENQTGRHPVTKIEALDALSAIKKYGQQVDYVLMCWSPDKLTIDMDVLNLIRNQYPQLKLLVIGEKNGATNSAEFWHNAKLSQDSRLQKVNQQISHFDLIDEQIYLAK